MRLVEIVFQLDGLSDDDWIGMQKPWSMDAQCRVSRMPDDLRWPESESSAGYAYFLEISTAREALEKCTAPHFSMRDRALVLLYYAEYDAWPNWALKLQAAT